MPPIRVLFVDDEPAILTLFRTILEMQDYCVQCAASAAEACAVLSYQPFDLVITDIHMENATAGHEVIRAAAAQTPRPPIVILSAYPLAEDEWRQTGADAFFIKGTDVPTVTRRLRYLLKRRTGLIAC